MVATDLVRGEPGWSVDVFFLVGIGLAGVRAVATSRKLPFSLWVLELDDGVAWSDLIKNLLRRVDGRK